MSGFISGSVLAPAAIGAGYALSKVLALRWLWPDLLEYQDFRFLFLSGILLGYTLRPVLQRIYWKYPTGAFAVGLLLLGLGTPGKLPELLLTDIPVQEWLSQSAMLDLGPILVTALLSPLLIPSFQTMISRQVLLSQLKAIFFNTSGSLKIIAAVVFYQALFFMIYGIYYWDEWASASRPSFLSPHLPLVSQLILIGCRGLTILIAFMPVLSMITSQNRWKVTLVCTSLLFVIADFIPTFSQISGISPVLLFDDLILRLFLDIIFCYGVAVLFV
ncbi:MAG: hypothetical protein HQM11_00575 [SAR324 cluster bacterium]|nr:hypothetical protein [SAR324 cluster bacterium]